MQQLNDFFTTLHQYIGGNNWFIFLLLGTGLFFTIYLKFPQIRYFRHAIKVVRGKYDKKDAKGDTTHFQSLATALSGTVGTGNIAWSYYGDRAITYLVGSRYVLVYRIIFVIAFFFASFIDTTIIWNLSMLTVAFMTVPNLIGMLILHKEVKQTVGDYWIGFRKEQGGKE